MKSDLSRLSSSHCEVLQSDLDTVMLIGDIHLKIALVDRSNRVKDGVTLKRGPKAWMEAESVPHLLAGCDFSNFRMPYGITEKALIYEVLRPFLRALRHSMHSCPNQHFAV